MLRVILGLLLLATTCFAQDVDRMDQVVQSFVSDNQFMGSALVARGDQVLFSKSYGSANLEWDVPNTPRTKFRIGSVTKQFTAACILLLEERGKLKIENPIKKYLPDAPAAWDKITIFHVLTHTSGIPSFTNDPEFLKLRPFEHTPEQLVALFKDKPLEFEPGEKMMYSNSGYVLLGYLLEKVSGEAYQDFLQKNIFDPLGMKDSGYDSNFAIIPRRAAGYTPGPDGLQNAEFEHMSIPFSAGAIYSTTEDLLRWEQGLFGGKLLSDASLKKMIEPFKDGYAFGVEVDTDDGRKKISHGGGISGFNAVLVYYPEDKLTVAVLANLNGAAPQEIAENLASLTHGEEVVLVSELKEITLPVKTLEQYVGTYELMSGINMMITVEDEQLMAQMTGQIKGPLFASSETQFFSKEANAYFDFNKDDKGAITSLTLHQHGMETNMPRISDKVEVQERKKIELSEKAMNQLAGKWTGKLDEVLTVRFEKNESGNFRGFAELHPDYPIISPVTYLSLSEGKVTFKIGMGVHNSTPADEIEQLSGVAPEIAEFTGELSDNKLVGVWNFLIPIEGVEDNIPLTLEKEKP